MEAVLSVAFGVWIVITAFVYRAVILGRAEKMNL